MGVIKMERKLQNSKYWCLFQAGSFIINIINIYHVTEYLLMNFMNYNISGAHDVLIIKTSHLYAFNSCLNQQLFSKFRNGSIQIKNNKKPKQIA